MARAAKIVLTCNPRSDATPTGKKRDPIRNLDAAVNSPSVSIPGAALDIFRFGAMDAATICAQHGASSTTVAGLATTWLGPA
jgi:hypothetical protein